MAHADRTPRQQQKTKQDQHRPAQVITPDENEQVALNELKTTSSLSPAAILRLQRTVGNSATIKMMQKQQISRTPDIQRGGKGEKYSALADMDELDDQDAPEALEVGRSGESGKLGEGMSAYSGKSAGEGLVDSGGQALKAVKPSGLEAMSDESSAKGSTMLTKAKELKAAFTDQPDASDSALQGMLTPLQAMKEFFQDAAVSSIAGVLSVGALIYGAYTKYTNWTAYDKAAQATVILLARETDEDSDKLSLVTKSQDETALSGAVVYAAAKTKRGFFTLLFRSILKVAQYIGRMITLFSGGVAGIVGEALDVAAGLTVAAEKGARAAKGFFKAITGKRGKNRTKSANVVVDDAIGGDVAALQLMIDLDLFGIGWKVKLKAKSFMTNKAEGLMSKLGAKVKVTEQEKLILMGDAPTTADTMKVYLLLCQKVGIIKDVKEAVSGSMKSQ